MFLVLTILNNGPDVYYQQPRISLRLQHQELNPVFRSSTNNKKILIIITKGAQPKTRKVRWLLQRFQVGMESFEIARKFSIVYNTRVNGASAENPRINSEANESPGDLTKVTLVFNAATQLFLTHKRLSRNDGKCQVQEKETQPSFPQSLSLPPVIWVLGGPGSCKATRVAKAVQGRPWKVVNFG